MLADFFTKLLQGSWLKKFREVIMGRKHISSALKKAPLSPSQERAENGELAGNVRPGGNGMTKDQPLIKKIGDDNSYGSVVRQGTVVEKNESHYSHSFNSSHHKSTLIDTSCRSSRRHPAIVNT